MELWGLFTSAFISSTLFPGGSEVVLGLLASNTEISRLTLIAVATLGNTLGGMSSWLIGFLLPSIEEKHQSALSRIKRWGSPVLLFSWLPVIGDPFCLVAGWLRLSFWKSLFFIATGKLIRYIAVIYLVA
jgi:membrane protein YqaA with SNARE-associated domain